MQQARRIRFFIIAIACAVLLSIAAFSVSYALWNMGDDNSSAAVDGSAGLFYVEYPQYVTDDGVSAPPLSAGKYYLQVPRRTNDKISDYYLFQNHNDNEKKLLSVYLYENDVVDLFYGTQRIGIENDDGGSDKTHISHDYDDTKKYTVQSEGFYDFYYKFNWNTMYVSYVGKPSASTGNTGTTTPTAPERDTSKNSVKIKFTDATIVFQMNTAINGVGDTYFHIWKTNNTPNDPKDTTLWPGLIMSTGADKKYTSGSSTKEYNSIEFNFSYTQVGGIILNNNSGPQTGDSNTFYKAVFGGALNANCTYTINAINNAHWNDFSSSSVEDFLKGKFSVSNNSGGGSGGGPNPADSRTKVKPSCNGATGFTGGELKPNTDIVPVRVMDGKMTPKKEGDKVVGYEYRNYICVSRPNADDSADDNSIAILEFTIKGKNGCDLSKIPVSSITLTRRDTDEEGNPQNGYIDPAPRIYNYDLTNPVYLSQIGHGDLHSTFEDVKGKNTENMIAHYDDGMYVILYFADKKQQYFALDLSIETTEEAEFTLTASVNNTNQWDRYKQGYGEEWGYYLGGLINEVWLWNPTRTTKFDASSGTVEFDFVKEGKALGILGINAVEEDVTPAKWLSLYSGDGGIGDTITKFNNDNNNSYQIADYSKNGTVVDESGFPLWARYTKEKVDITLTINLVANSKVKLCMLDWSGQRGDIGNDDVSKRILRPTTYYLPNKIVSSDGLFENRNTYDEKLNFLIPESGEYSFRYVGYVHNYVGKSISLWDGSISDDGGTGYASIPEYNFVIDTLYISKAETVGEMIKVEFNPGDGTFAAAAPTEQLVRFGNKVDFSEGKAPLASNITPPTNKTFVGWYYVQTNDDGTTTNVDYTSAPVLDDLVLYAKYEGLSYTITFDPNGGALPYGVANTAKTDENGYLSQTDLDKRTPTRTGGYTFVGWFTGSKNGDKVTTEYDFASNQTIYAHWDKQKFEVTFDLNGLPIATTPSKQNVEYGQKASAPTVSDVPTHYTLEGWYTDPECASATKFNFNNGVTRAMTLYANWYADNGIYANNVYVKEISENYEEWGTTHLRVKAVDVPLKANDIVTFWWNHAQIETNVSIRSNSPGYGKITGTSYTNIKVITPGWYSLYYDAGNSGEIGIWAIYNANYADLTLHANDGVYNGTTKLKAFTQSATKPYELEAKDVTLTAKTTITVKYNNTNQTVASLKENSLGTLASGKVTLEKGKYSFYYTYADNILYIDGTPDTPTDPNAGKTFGAVNSSSGWVVGSFSASGKTPFDWNNGYQMTISGNEYQIKRLYLTAGDTFKVRAGDYYGSGCNTIRGGTGISNTSAYLKSGSGNDNVQVVKTGYYDFYVSNGQNIWFAYSET